MNNKHNSMSLNSNNLLQITIRNFRYSSPTKSSCENEIIESINPKQLFYDSHIQESENNLFSKEENSEKNNNANSTIIAEKTNFELLKNYLEKSGNTDKIEILKYYNYSKLYKYQYNENFFYEDYEKTFSNIFKPIIPLESNTEDRMLIENEIENLKNRYDKILKEPELLKLFNFKFDKFTILQKLVTLWGLVNYGFSYGTVLSEIPNIFSFTKSITYENEEIVNFLNKTLEEFKVDSFISSFENINFINYDRINNFNNKIFILGQGKKTNINFLRKNNEKFNKYIYNLDPPMLNNTNWNFYYNKKIFQMKKMKEENKKELKYINNNTNIESKKLQQKLILNEILMKPTKEILEDYPIINLKEIENKANKKSGINLILSNPIFTLENKKIIFNLFKDFMKKLCEKIEVMYNESQINFKKYNIGKALFLL